MELETTTNTRWKRALWIIVLPVLAVGAFSLPRALAWHHHKPAATSEELAEHLEDGLDHLLDKVDATDQQRAQANAIAARRAPELFSVMTEGRAVREQLRQVLLADQLDKAKLEQAQVQVDALTQKASAIGLSAVFELSQVLTPAQRKQVADRLAGFER
jgi:Spy/CpxP family protein refolding chaperone